MLLVTNLVYLFLVLQSITQTLYIVYALTFHFMVTPNFIYLASSSRFRIFLFLVIQICQVKSNDLMIVMKWPPHGKTTFGLARVFHSLYGMIFGKNIQIGRSSSVIYFQF
jgi:hypothetical protein